MAFDTVTATAPDSTVYAEERKPAEHGIKKVRQAITSLYYERIENNNRLSILYDYMKNKM